VLVVDQSQREVAALVEWLVVVVELRQAIPLHPQEVLQGLEAMVLEAEDLEVGEVAVEAVGEVVAVVVVRAEAALELEAVEAVLVAEAVEAPQLTCHNGNRICKAVLVDTSQQLLHVLPLSS